MRVRAATTGVYWIPIYSNIAPRMPYICSKP
jgi:hypothetical protein